MKLETLEDGIAHLKYLISFPKMDNSYIILNKTIVNYANKNDVNQEFCDINNIETTYLKRQGGTFVFGEGDIVFLHSGWNDHFGPQWIQYLKNKLIKYNLDIKQDNNDLLVDGYKFLGDTQINMTDIGYNVYICCISIKHQPNLIQTICNKNTVKIPRGLSYYGLTSDIIEKWYLDFVFYFNK